MSKDKSISKNSKLEKEKNIIINKIQEYDKIEKYFGTDGKGNILYDDKKDQDLIIRNINENKSYTGYDSFVEWIDNKNKNELRNELYIIEDKLDKLIQSSKVQNPSGEQKTIIDAISNGNNILVDAVAGSGKTTTVLFIAEKNPNKKILQITYNKQLKLEVREKVIAKGYNNLEIHTYHSLSVKFYDENAHTDDKIIKVLSKNITPKFTRRYDILIIDEVQDMTPNYYSLIHKFINDMNLKDSTLLILGDRYQGVYEFKNADIRFLTFSDKIWYKPDFGLLPLQESYRITKQIAWFVNNVMLGQNRIISNKQGKHKVYYYKSNKFSIHVTFAKKIMEFIKEGYKPSDIFVLSPSLKSSENNPVKKLENLLVSNNIPVYFSRSDEDGIDEDIIKGKTVFTTFHQAKGRERKVVFVFGFDDSYFDFHAKEKDRNICPSELYVAVTRASEILIVLENDRDEQLSFMKQNHAQMKQSGMIEYFGKTPIDNKKKQSKCIQNDFHTTSATELIRYMSEDNNSKLIPLVNNLFTIISKPKTKYTVEIPLNISTANGLTEDVSDLNGLVIPAMYESKQKKEKSSLESMVEKIYQLGDENTKSFIEEKLPDFQKYFKHNKISAYLCLGNMYIALVEKIHSKLKQIDSYDWLTKDMIKICHKNLSKNIGDNAIYEKELGNFANENGKPFYQYKSNTYGSIDISARIDCYDTDTLWEFKCVSSLQMDHMLQLIVYAWIWEKCMKEKYGMKKYKLLNIRTGEVRELKYDNFIIEQIMNIVFDNKYRTKEKDSDILFLEKCKKVLKNSNEECVNINYKSENSDCDEDSFMFGQPPKKNTFNKLRKK